MTQREICEKIIAGSCEGIECLRTCPASMDFGNRRSQPCGSTYRSTSFLAKRRARAWLKAHPLEPLAVEPRAALVSRMDFLLEVWHDGCVNGAQGPQNIHAIAGKHGVMIEEGI